MADPATRRFRIVCVDTALPALAERGIRADLAVALEAQHWNIRDFIGLGEGPQALAMDLSAQPGTVAAVGGEGTRTFFFCTRWTALRFFDRLDEAGLLPMELPPLGSVGLSAVALALSVGRGPLFLAGLDFAYRCDAYHGRGTPGHRSRLAAANRLRSCIDPAPAFRPGSEACRDKEGLPVRTDPALRGYRNLFQRDFSTEQRITDLGTTGLDLGVQRQELETAVQRLTEVGRAGWAPPVVSSGTELPRRARLRAFAEREYSYLTGLRDILSGTGRAGNVGRNSDEGRATIEETLDTLDYLWAHFPECAAAEGLRPPASDLSFLKRARAELDPFLKDLSLTLAELDRA